MRNTGCPAVSYWLRAANAGTSSSTLGTAPAALSRKPRLSRRQQLQAQAAVTIATAQPHGTTDATVQGSGTASQGSACVNQRPSHNAAGSQAQGDLQHLAAQICQQNACQSTGGMQGIRLCPAWSARHQCRGSCSCVLGKTAVHALLLLFIRT